jgi:hypothetical protein
MGAKVITLDVGDAGEVDERRYDAIEVISGMCMLKPLNERLDDKCPGCERCATKIATGIEQLPRGVPLSRLRVKPG